MALPLRRYLHLQFIQVGDNFILLSPQRLDRLLRLGAPRDAAFELIHGSLDLTLQLGGALVRLGESRVGVLLLDVERHHLLLSLATLAFEELHLVAQRRDLHGGVLLFQPRLVNRVA